MFDIGVGAELKDVDSAFRGSGTGVALVSAGTGGGLSIALSSAVKGV